MGSRETPSSCSKTHETLNLETPESSSTDPDSPLEEQWPKSAPDLKEEDSMDMVLEDSKEPLTPSSPPTGREVIRYEVNVNQRNIEDICLCCGSLQVYAQHPLFEGGICAPCKDKFLETLFLYDEDGHQSYCTICCSGHTLFICESPDCTRCYCFECVDILVGPGTSERINAMACWVCFLCLPFSRSGLLQRRKKWRHQLKAFHDREGASPVEIYKTVSAWKRQPVRVLSLFGNIDKELKSLGFLESSSGSEGGTLKYVEDVTNVVRREVEKWGPFDLVYGSTQPLGYSCDRCPGWYMFQFHRILQYARPRQDSQQPFFWIFVDNLLLTEDDQETTVRFLQTEAVTLQDVRGRVLQNAMRVWSNIPGLKSKHADLTPKEEQSLQTQVRTRSKLAAQKVDSLVKYCLLPLREYFKYFSQNSLPL
uniref:DNA (cytosine-5)-methyltransferase 3-like n=2 Tax=Rattus norvegicus TaxID=10116 RepID=DNM3L_RAT|nr:RecName: Full=DNA (cytosine-5)-methyltransferase 3-like [Rattus norvegicus]CAE52320.1 TPA: putative DNA (cytosine-5) methyltransferase 3-like protein [Rattus norvegicus]|eukprot:NP_001003964.1 DNA (cytosine-5)-methyltransferase 3-like [Rattus norvegicus]